MKKQGKGTFVLGEEILGHLDGIGGFHDAMGNMEKGTAQKLLSVDELQPDTEMARYLGMEKEGKAVAVKRISERRRRTGHAGHLLLFLCSVFLESADIFPVIFSIYQIMRDEYQVRMASAEKVIKVRKVRRDEEEFPFTAKRETRCFDLFKVVYDEEGIPVHASVSVLRGENTSYIIFNRQQQPSEDQQPGAQGSAADCSVVYLMDRPKERGCAERMISAAVPFWHPLWTFLYTIIFLFAF